MNEATLTAEAAPKACFADYLALTKPRLSFLSVVTALVGYAAARPACDGVLGACHRHVFMCRRRRRP